MTESRPPYQAGSTGEDRYDENGLDPWGVSREQKEQVFAKLALRFEDQSDSMAALLLEYRNIESLSQDRLLAKLEISPAQYSHLALCLVPDPDDNFADDLKKIVSVSGANIFELASICREVYALREFPRRSLYDTAPQNERQRMRARGYAMRALAARDRAAKSMREESVDYLAKADAAAPASQAAAAPPAPGADVEIDSEPADDRMQSPASKTEDKPDASQPGDE